MNTVIRPQERTAFLQEKVLHGVIAILAIQGFFSFFSFFGKFFFFVIVPKEGGLNLYNRLGNAICIDSLKDRLYILKVFHALTPSIHCLGRYIEGLGMGCRQRSFFALERWVVPLQTGSVLMGMKNPNFYKNSVKLWEYQWLVFRGHNQKNYSSFLPRTTWGIDRLSISIESPAYL